MSVISIFRRSGRHSRAADPFEDAARAAYLPAPPHPVPEMAHDRTAPMPQPRWGERAAWPPPAGCNSASGRGVPGCKCDGCKYGNVPGADAVLYAGPDAMWLYEMAAIRDGRYEDAAAYADEAEARISARFDAAERRTKRTLAPAIRTWQRADAARRAVAA